MATDSCGFTGIQICDLLKIVWTLDFFFPHHSGAPLTDFSCGRVSLTVVSLKIHHNSSKFPFQTHTSIWNTAPSRTLHTISILGNSQTRLDDDITSGYLTSEGNPNVCVRLLSRSRLIKCRLVHYIWLTSANMWLVELVKNDTSHPFPYAPYTEQARACRGVSQRVWSEQWASERKERKLRDSYNLGLVAQLLLISHSSPWRRSFTAPPGGDSPGNACSAVIQHVKQNKLSAQDMTKS